MAKYEYAFKALMVDIAKIVTLMLQPVRLRDDQKYIFHSQLTPYGLSFVVRGWDYSQ